VTPPTTEGRRPRPSTGTRVTAGILVLIPIVALMWVPSYTKATPRLWGFPFFYWYQLLWLFIATGCVVAAYLLLNRRAPRNEGSDR
jgi:hypothetical protein